MGRHDDLNAAFGCPGDRLSFCGLLRLQQQEVEYQHLQLRVQMRFRFFDQEQRQIRVASFGQFDDDGGDVEKIGIAETGGNDVLKRNAGVSQLETEVSGDIAQRLGRKVERRGLRANALRQVLERVADLRIDGCDDTVLHGCSSDMREKVGFFSVEQEIL